ncbi:hypothetical protein BBW68_00855 [Candidatus Erwinia dacicola]|uniref:Uncharacterized protein n=1 Tax=Candidatus Erwinia dacicola TaxID=252393 RepID=A0A1E7Z2S8_9GAMM|nr:hypothetical protein BBW68_07575 [Candidatus Erwinia dacicola]OFC63539.1 hypothetical protein BBW68_00855 [Candidatus Erwinia dacicola]
MYAVATALPDLRHFDADITDAGLNTSLRQKTVTHHRLATVIETEVSKPGKHHSQFSLNRTGDQPLCTSTE